MRLDIPILLKRSLESLDVLWLVNDASKLIRKRLIDVILLSRAQSMKTLEL